MKPVSSSYQSYLSFCIIQTHVTGFLSGFKYVFVNEIAFLGAAVNELWSALSLFSCILIGHDFSQLMY